MLAAAFAASPDGGDTTTTEDLLLSSAAAVVDLCVVGAPATGCRLAGVLRLTSSCLSVPARR